MNAQLSRRSFVAGSAALGVAAGTVASAGIAKAATADFTFADTVAWNAEYECVLFSRGEPSHQQMMVIIKAMKQELIAAHLPAVFTENREILQVDLNALADFIIVKGMDMGA